MISFIFIFHKPFPTILSHPTQTEKAEGKDLLLPAGFFFRLKHMVKHKHPVLYIMIPCDKYTF